jgi:hypothetical protein
MRFSVFVAISTFAVGIAAQSNYTYPSGFEPGQISPSQAASWCLSERNTCPEVCGDGTQQNQCDASALTFNCTCANGTVPDLSLYEGTLPYLICQANFGQCQSRNAGDLTAQQACTTQNICGSLTVGAAAATTASTTTTASTAITSTPASNTASASTPSATSTSSKAAGMGLQSAQNPASSLFVTILMSILSLFMY